MNREEARAYLSKRGFGLSKREKLDKKMSRTKEDSDKHLYKNPHPPIPNAEARIAEAIKQAEQTQRNIDALNKGEDK
jgi:hypothetical protein